MASQQPGSDIPTLLFSLALDKSIQIFISYWTINETCASLSKAQEKRSIK